MSNFTANERNKLVGDPPITQSTVVYDTPEYHLRKALESAQLLYNDLCSERRELEDRLAASDWSAAYQTFLKLVDRSPATDWYYALGLAGETGEIAEKIKKKHRDGQFDRNQFLLELGDVLWYLTRLAMFHNSTLEEIAALNQQKLQSRKDRNVLHGSGDNR